MFCCFSKKKLAQNRTNLETSVIPESIVPELEVLSIPVIPNSEPEVETEQEPEPEQNIPNSSNNQIEILEPIQEDASENDSEEEIILESEPKVVKITNKVNEETDECPICLKESHVFSFGYCQHKLCFECLILYLKKNIEKEKIKCPICRDIIIKDNNSITVLTPMLVNGLIPNMIDLIDKISDLEKNIENEKKTLQNKIKTIQTKYDTECQEHKKTLKKLNSNEL